MTREEAIKILSEKYNYALFSERTALETLIPELKENEDERIRKELVGMIKACTNWVHKKEYIAYLEKQKENPKSADSVPSDCVSDAKYENRWHKVGDSLPDNPREVLCKDEAGNYFIGRYYVGEGWEISNYDDEDKPHHLNPPVSKWIDFPSEKQKEQRDYRKLYEDIAQSEWFKKAYVSKSLGEEFEQKEQKQSINIDQLKSLMLQYLQEASNEKDDSAIEADTDKWARKILGYDFEQKEQKPVESISRLTVQSKGVYKICPRCKSRMIRDDSKVYTSMPPQYGYECPKCGEMEFDTAMYDNPEMEEQKPVDDKAFEEWIDGWYNEHHRDGYVTMDEREFKNFCRGIRNMYQQKPAEWSKNDTVFLNEIIDYFDNKTVRLQHDLDMYAHWLKSLPERFNLQPKQEWSEEDEKMMNLIKTQLRILQSHLSHAHSKSMSDMEYSSRLLQIEKCVSWLDIRLKSLRPQSKVEWSEDVIRKGIKEVGLTQYQINWLKSNVFPPKEEQKSEEWSEKDEKMLLSIINAFRNGAVSTIGQEQWLKSLPERFNLEPKEQKPLEYLPKKKVYDIMSKLTSLSFSPLFPINSEEYKKIDEITSDVCGLLDYPIEWQKEGGVKETKVSCVENVQYGPGYFLDGSNEDIES